MAPGRVNMAKKTIIMAIVSLIDFPFTASNVTTIMNMEKHTRNPPTAISKLEIALLYFFKNAVRSFIFR